MRGALFEIKFLFLDEISLKFSRSGVLKPDFWKLFFEKNLSKFSDRMSQLNGVEVRASSGAWIPKAQILNYDPNQERVTIEFKDQE